MKTGPITEAKQIKQCVYNIPCKCGRCYIGEISGPLEVCLKEHKYNLTQSLLEKSKLVKHAYEEDHKICCKEARSRKLNRIAHTENAGKQPIWFWLGHLFYLYPYYSSRSQQTATPVMQITVRIISSLLLPYRKFVEDSGTDSILFLAILSMKQCTYIEVMLHMCGDSRCDNVNPHWWIVLFWLYERFWCCWCPETEISSSY
jgi:hypothetical protein